MTGENQKGALAIAQAQPLENPSEFFTHGEGDSPRTHASEKTRGSVLGFAVLLTLTFSAVELIGGWFANSLALIGDAGHMLTDSMSLFFALIANRIAMKGADKVHSFGHGRVEVIAAFVNGLIMLGVVLWLFLEAFERIREPAAVSGFNVMTIALTGLIINVGVASGALPTKGLTLPFVSFGGSALLSSMIAIGLLLRVDRENKILMRGGQV